MKKLGLAVPTMLGLALALSGCVSFGTEPPPSLLTLTANNALPAGAESSTTRETAFAVYEPGVPQSINVPRVPVQVDPTTIAYLKDAVWVEKPARLFKQLLMETVSAQSGRLVVEGEDPTILADDRLRGTINKFGYDAQSMSVVVQYDAVRQMKDGPIQTRRFESVIPVAAAEAGFVGDALNRAANDVAGEVADWISAT